MSEEKPQEQLVEQGIQDVLSSMLQMAEAETVGAYAAFAATPAAQAAVTALRAGDFDRFYFALQYPAGQAIDGLLATEFPGAAEDLRFLFRNGQFIQYHIERLIDRYEGGACCVDKTRSVMRAIYRYLQTKQEISFDYQQEFTFHLPKRVFTVHQLTWDYFKSLQSLYYGHTAPYLQALLALQNGVKKVENSH